MAMMQGTSKSLEASNSDISPLIYGFYVAYSTESRTEIPKAKFTVYKNTFMNV